MLFLKKLPIFIILLIFTAFIMFIPAIFGLINNEFEAARSFFYYGLLILLISFFLAVASLNRAKSSPVRSQLLIVISSFVILPIFFMLPLLKLLPTFDAHSLYFEMVSCYMLCCVIYCFGTRLNTRHTFIITVPIVVHIFP